METHKPYSRSHAEGLLKPCGNHWLIDERGVWPVVMDYNEAEGLGLVTEYEVMSWTPVMVFKDDQNAPDCTTLPALPFPFDDGDLAAFMLAGVGAFVAVHYGGWDNGPSEEALDEIEARNNYARRAVRAAFDAYRLAIEKVGKCDMDALARRDAAHKAYWKSSNDKALLKAFEDAESEWDAAYQMWLTKMVRCLLEPQAAALAPVVSSRADDGDEWKEQARQMAREIIARQKANDLHPSQEDIADEIAREFRAAGKPLTGAYIKRHALKGISSAQNRQLSTSIRRGK